MRPPHRVRRCLCLSPPADRRASSSRSHCPHCALHNICSPCGTHTCICSPNSFIHQLLLARPQVFVAHAAHPTLGPAGGLFPALSRVVLAPAAVSTCHHRMKCCLLAFMYSVSDPLYSSAHFLRMRRDSMRCKWKWVAWQAPCPRFCPNGLPLQTPIPMALRRSLVAALALVTTVLALLGSA